MTDVSIIIPTYNRLWCLPRAVESCRNTQYSTQIIVVDDGSTDGTWAWLEQQKDILALRQDNWGKCWAVNKAFDLGRGEYVRFLDSDDWLLPAADSQIALARSQQADVVVAGYGIFNEKEVLVRQSPWQDCDDFIAQQLGECDSSHYSAYLFRREFIAEIPHRPDFAWRDDRLFVIEVALRKPRISISPDPAFAQRHHGRGRLQFPEGMRAVATNFQHLLIYKKCLAKLEARGELTLRRKKAAAKVLWPLAHWIAYTHLDEAGEVADWVFKLDPEFRVPESGALGTLYRSLGFRGTERLLMVRRALLSPFRQSPPKNALDLPA